jgi:hypothetical protein
VRFATRATLKIWLNKAVEITCHPYRDRTRTFETMVARIWKHFDDQLKKKTEEVIAKEAA